MISAEKCVFNGGSRRVGVSVLININGIGQFELTIELLCESKLDLSRFAAQMTKIILKIALFCHYFALSFRKGIVLRID